MTRSWMINSQKIIMSATAWSTPSQLQMTSQEIVSSTLTQMSERLSVLPKIIASVNQWKRETY